MQLFKYSFFHFNHCIDNFIVLLIMLNAIILGIVYYPVLVCITQRKYIIVNVLGIAYVAP